MTSTPARLPLPRKRIASRLPRRRQRTTVSGRPGSVTISLRTATCPSGWHAVSCQCSHLSCGFDSHREHFLTLFEQNRSPPASTKRTNQSRKELLFRLHVWAVTGMVPAPSGLAFLATHSCRCAVSDAWYGVPTTLPTLHPHRRRRPPSPTRRQR